MLLFFLPVLMGAECDPDQPIRSSFDNEFVPLRRDNVVASGFIYDEHDELPGYDYAAAVYLPSDVYRVETDLILEYQGGKLYSFYQDPTELPLSLQPAGNTNMVAVGLRRGPNEFKMLYSTILYMDPNVIVLPVYTWRLWFSEAHVPSAAYFSSTAMRWAFDRAKGNVLPEAMKDSVAGQKVDQVWTQCDIQFRLAGHFDLKVPECYTLAVEPTNDPPSGIGENCFSCPSVSTDCAVGSPCRCNPQNKPTCTVGKYLLQNGHFVPDAINIYFVGSFSARWEDGSPTLGIACTGIPSEPWIFVNSIRMDSDEGRTLLAHEIGHILLKAGNSAHEPGTLMQAGNHLLEALTPEQCQAARTTDAQVLSTKL